MQSAGGGGSSSSSSSSSINALKGRGGLKRRRQRQYLGWMCVREWERTSAAINSRKAGCKTLELHVVVAAVDSGSGGADGQGGFAHHHRRLRHHDHDDDDNHHHDCRRRHRCTSITIAVVASIVAIAHQDHCLRASCACCTASSRGDRARPTEARLGDLNPHGFQQNSIEFSARNLLGVTLQRNRTESVPTSQGSVPAV